MHKPYVGDTNNILESYNRVLKDFQNWKERPLDTVVEGFVHLQQYHIKEVARGLAGTGQYVLNRPAAQSTLVKRTRYQYLIIGTCIMYLDMYRNKCLPGTPCCFWVLGPKIRGQKCAGSNIVGTAKDQILMS